MGTKKDKAERLLQELKAEASWDHKKIEEALEALGKGAEETRTSDDDLVSGTLHRYARSARRVLLDAQASFKTVQDQVAALDKKLAAVPDFSAADLPKMTRRFREHLAEHQKALTGFRRSFKKFKAEAPEHVPDALSRLVVRYSIRMQEALRATCEKLAALEQKAGALEAKVSKLGGA